MRDFILEYFLAISSSCASANFTCRNGQCISRRKVCDGQADCSDNSDEDTRFCCKRNMLFFRYVTFFFLAAYNCRPTEYRCLSGACIPYVERCDRKIGKNFKEQEDTYF